MIYKFTIISIIQTPFKTAPEGTYLVIFIQKLIKLSTISENSMEYILEKSENKRATARYKIKLVHRK